MKKTLVPLSISMLIYISASSQNIQTKQNGFNSFRTAEVNTGFIDDNPEPLNISKESYEMENLDADFYRKRQIRAADLHMDRMQYESAALLYEEALKNGEKATYDVIRKIGDAYYLNLDVEKSYKWYELLYKNYKKEIAPKDLYKYSQALKSVRKYNKADYLSNKAIKLIRKEKETTSITNDYSLLKSESTILNKSISKISPIKIKNLDLNTKHADFAPTFVESGSIVFASAEKRTKKENRYNKKSFIYYDLYQAPIPSGAAEVTEPIKLSGAINTKQQEVSATFSKDFNTIFFTRSNQVKSLNENNDLQSKIYKSEKVGDDWTTPEPVSFSSDYYSTGHPTLSPSGKRLYFVSDMPGSLGGADIFVVDIDANGEFSKPRNLGPQVNTPYEELFPFVTEEKLYFSSDGHKGLGGLDVFEVTIEENGSFSRLENAGRPVNSVGDDFSYIKDEKNHSGFFSSNRPGGKGDDDIYFFSPITPLEVVKSKKEKSQIINSEKSKPMKTDFSTNQTSAISEGIVTHSKLDPLKLESKKLQTLTTVVEFKLPNESINHLKAKSSSALIAEKHVKRLEEPLANTSNSSENGFIVTIKGEKRLKSDRIYFDFDSSRINKKAKMVMDQLVLAMTENKNMIIKINSFTDIIGDETYNKWLSEKRGQTTLAYLLSQGIAPQRIESVTGQGEDTSVVRCYQDCDKNNLKNSRRSEFTIVKM